MSATLAMVGAGALLVSALVYAVYRLGRSVERKGIEAELNEIRSKKTKAQLEVANREDKGKEAIIDRMRNSGL